MNSYDKHQLDRLDPSYLAQYGLREAPFASIHDDRFLYLDAERAQHLNMLRHLAQYSDLLLIASGEHGIGKTSLLQRFIKTADKDWRICQVEANAMMDADRLMRDIANGFGLHVLPNTPAQMQEALYEYLTALHHDDIVPILIIDDAHELPEDALESLFLLADAQTSDSHLLRIILFCQPQIERILQASAIRPLRERITHTIDILPLSEEQTLAYIKHRLHVAGLDGGNPIPSKILKKIYKHTLGIPAQINRMAHKILQDGAEELVEENHYDHHALPSFISRRNILLVVFTLGIVIAMLAMQDAINSMFEDETVDVAQPITEVSSVSQTQQLPLEEKVIELRVDPVTKTLNVEQTTLSNTEKITQTEDVKAETVKHVEPVIIKQNENAIESQAEQKDKAAQKPTALVADNTNKTDVSSKVLTKKDSEDVSLPTIISLKPDPVVGSKSRQSITLTGTGFSPDTKVTVTWSKRSKQLAASQVQVISDTELQIKIATGVNPDKWKVTATNPQHGKSNIFVFNVVRPKSKITITKPILRSTGLRVDWLLTRDPQHFTVQLLGIHNKQAVGKFINQHKLSGDIAYFKSQRSGGAWYNLVKGEYATQVQAIEALRNLPTEVKKAKPWIRRFVDIQTMLNSSTVKVATSTNIPSTLTDQTSWLWSQNPQYFTLQLLGSRYEQSVQQFVKTHSLKGKAVYFNIRQKSKDWFALLYGVYPNREAALKARDQLSAQLRKASPWIRSFAEIHEQMARDERANLH